MPCCAPAWCCATRKCAETSARIATNARPRAGYFFCPARNDVSRRAAFTPYRTHLPGPAARATANAGSAPDTVVPSHARQRPCRQHQHATCAKKPGHRPGFPRHMPPAIRTRIPAPCSACACHQHRHSHAPDTVVPSHARQRRCQRATCTNKKARSETGLSEACATRYQSWDSCTCTL